VSLKDQRSLIVGIANPNSTAFGFVEALRRAGAELAVTYRNATAGPMATRAASGIECFDELLERTRARTPEHRLVSIEDVGNLAAFLVNDGAAALTGNIEYVDAGYHIVG
jgi:enoyl-[acyl-carrier protein] reductase I